jgi:type II secretion system protein J
LLEVLVASAILSLVLAALYGVFSQTLTSKRLTEERAEQARTARIALLRIGEDLQSALPPTSKEIHFLGKTRLTQEFPEDTLSFVTLTRVASTTRTPEGDLSEIAYGVEPDPSDITQKQLVRRVRFTLSPRNDAADEAAPLLLQVHGLRFRFFDGREWQQEWRQEQTQNQLPRAVETTVYVADSRGKILPFSTVITLPLADTKRGKAT